MIKPVLHFFQLSDAVTAFSTTRHGGVSKGKLASLNINAFRGDDPEAVAQNLQAVAELISVQPNHIVRLHQIHETNCLLVDEAFMYLDQDVQRELREGKDAVITKLKQVCIGVHTADCVPILFYDPIHEAVGAAHAGWRGTVKHIAKATLKAMQENFQTQPQDLQVVIGPAISLKNFEVGQEVYDAFDTAGYNMSAISQRFDKWHINLPLANQLDLEAEGVKRENILQSGICTYDHSDDFFSARILKEGFGTIYTGIVLR